MEPYGPVQLLERQTLCLASSNPGFSVHRGDESFAGLLQRHYSASESNANEKLVLLKQKLSLLPDDQFWTVLLEGIADILRTQISLVAQHILPNDSAVSVEIPAHPKPGSCLMAVATYSCRGRDFQHHTRDHRYLSYGGPCAQMRHDKVFLVPSNLADYARDRADEFQVPVDIYLGIPLFSSRQCFGHLGAMWTTTSMRKSGLSWGFIEMTLHSLEDLITTSLLQREGFEDAAALSVSPSVRAKSAVSKTRSLKPYARRMSHELRTPMQGVVGMFDLMHANVQEALEGIPDRRSAQALGQLRENIETIQDSSRRAVEAADNVVHAYDLDMQVPVTPDDGSVDAGLSPRAFLPLANAQVRTTKRKRSTRLDLKIQEPRAKNWTLDQLFQSHERGSQKVKDSQVETPQAEGPTSRSRRYKTPLDRLASAEALQPSPVTPAVRPVVIRDLIRTVVNESLRFSGRPDSAVTTLTAEGEQIEVRARSLNGDASTKIIEWSVDPSVPGQTFVDERDFAKLVSAVLSNALKFTKHGSVKLVVRLGQYARSIVVRILDTGCGIPQSFQKQLFKPFSREDDSLTRQSEGLGLGLLVAKGVARKMGGDISLLRSDIEGPYHGSEFELWVPFSSFIGRNQPGTPSQTPLPPPLEAVDASALPESDARNDGLRSAGHAWVALDWHGANQSPQPPTPPLETSPSPGESEPLPKPSAKHTRAVIAPSFNKRLSRSHPLQFLVVEDNRINRRLLMAMLSKLGYSGTREAFDGVEAVKFMEADHRTPSAEQVDVILMDLWMPNMDGYEATQRILAMEQKRAGRGKRNGRVKILAVTADATDGALERARAVGMEGLLAKPYNLLDLERLIVEYCLPAEERRAGD